MVVPYLAISLPVSSSSSPAGSVAAGSDNSDNGSLHAPQSHHIFTISSTASYNWGGFVAASSMSSPGAVVTAVYGSWIVQTVKSSSSSTYSSQWIGIGGYFSSDASLIQTGTESDSASGSTSYYAWYELLPASETEITSLTVSPGDVINASVVCMNLCSSTSQTWTITLKDVTTDKMFSDSGVVYSSSLLSADWIEERPCIRRFLLKHFRFRNAGEFWRCFIWI